MANDEKSEKTADYENETIATEESPNSLDGLSDAELVKLVEELDTEVTHLELENQVLENFLLKNDPSSIAGMVQILEAASKLQAQAQNSLLVPNIERKDTADSIHAGSRKTDSLIRFAGLGTTSIAERGPRINLSQRMDLVMREMEEMQIALEIFIQKSHRIKCNFRAELEEIGIREAEVTEARDIFEHRIAIEGVDSLTQRIPAEKFLRYMEEWLKSAESTIEKMRLRTSTLKITFTKVSNQLVQKEELGEAIDAVDFDQLRIENQRLAQKIDQKNTHLLELKKMNGAANLVLSTHKKYLLKQMQDLNSVKDLIKSKETKIVQFDEECEKVEKQVDKERDKYEEVIGMIQNYKVPDTMEYVNIKAKLHELEKNVKIWTRRKNIQQFALNTCIREMKNLTGIKLAPHSWFKVEDKYQTDEDSLFGDDMEFNGYKPNIMSKLSFSDSTEE